MLQEGKLGWRIGEEPLLRQPGPRGRTPVGRTNQGDKSWPPRGEGGVTQMSILFGDKGREVAKDGPGPKGVRDSPSSLEGTRLVSSLLAVVRVTSLESSIVDRTGLPF